MDKYTKLVIIILFIFSIFIFYGLIYGLTKLFLKNTLFGSALTIFIIAIIIGICCYLYKKQKEKQEIEEKERNKESLEKQKQQKMKELEMKEKAMKKENLINDTNFENKYLIKAILENDRNINIDDFFKKILLCDKLKKHNKKFILDDYILIFNGFFIKFCKMENLNISVYYIDMSSYHFNYHTYPYFDRKNNVIIDSFCISDDIFNKYELPMSKENKENLENHIEGIINDIYGYKNDIDTFVDLKKFDYQSFFENETINNIIKILIEDIQFYNEVKTNSFKFSDKESIYNDYIYLANEFKKWKDEKERQRIVEEERKKRIFEEKYTSENSLLYNKLLELNQKYKNKENLFIANVCKEHLFEIECKSKTEYDRFDFDKKAIEEIKKDTYFYYSFSEVIKEAEDNYKWYLKKYKNLIKLYSVKNDTYKLNINYERFKFNEDKLYNENKINLPNYPTMKIKISYITPSFRYSYENEKVYNYEEILTLIEKSKDPSKSELRKQQEKSLRDEIKYLKEQLNLVQQNQIYSQQKEEQQNIEVNSNNSISINLKYYRTLYENGEISKEEYEQKRKELMG